MNAPEMSDAKLRWVFAGFAMFVGVSYFLWLCMVYAKFMDTDRFVRATITEHYASRPAPDITLDAECEDCPDVPDSP